MAGTTDELDALLVRCGNGDRRAFTKLYEIEAPRLYGIALHLTKQPSLAADAVHNTFMNVWQRGVRFEPTRGSAKAWLSTLPRYRAVDILRRNPHELDLEVPDIPDAGPDALSQLADREDATRLRACMELLPQLQRRLVTLAFFEGLSHAKLANRVQMPLGTVKSALRGSLLKLRGCLSGRGIASTFAANPVAAAALVVGARIRTLSLRPRRSERWCQRSHQLVPFGPRVRPWPVCRTHQAWF